MKDYSTADKLYDALSLIMELIDHSDNPQLKDDEILIHEIRYDGRLQKQLRGALKAYQGSIHCHGDRNCRKTI
jgi:hypothetical protein